jgi:CheY-like chemotaxis protein
MKTQRSAGGAAMEPVGVMVVDDEEAIRRTLRRHLERSGYSVRTAADGQEALAEFTRTPADVLVTDLNMPRMGGLELLRRVRQHCPRVISVVLTGYGSLDSAVEAIRQGCDEYLLKPVHDLGLLSASIERCLKRRRVLNHGKAQTGESMLDMLVENFSDKLSLLEGHIDLLEKTCRADTRALQAILEASADIAQMQAVLKDVCGAHRFPLTGVPAAVPFANGAQ